MGSQTAALKFAGVRILSVLGWRLSLTVLATLGIAAWAVLVLAVLAGSLLALRLIRDGLTPATVTGTSGGAGTTAVVVLGLAACLYLALGACAREAFSSRRFAVRFSPNRALYRAVDVRMHHVFFAEAGPRAALLFGPSAAICSAALIVIHEHGRETAPWYGVLWVTPFLVTGSWLALSARLAAVDPSRPTVGRRLALAGLASVAAGVPGIFLGRVLTDLPDSGKVPALAVPSGLDAGPWAILAAVAAGLVCAGSAARSLLSIKSDPFPVTAKIPGTGASAVTVPTDPARIIGWFLALNIVRDKSFAVLTGIGLGLLLLASVVLGLRMGGIGPAYFEQMPGIGAVAALIVFMASLIGSELISKANNPAGLLPQLRYAFESGVPAGRLAWAVVLTQSLPLTALAAPTLAMIVWILTGDVAVGLVCIPWTIAVAGIIGATVSRIRATQADGSMETSLAAAFIAVVLSVPALGLSLVGGLYPSIAAAAYAALLTGGANRCLKRSILSRR